MNLVAKLPTPYEHLLRLMIFLAIAALQVEAQANQRWALVIGNSHYFNAPSLANTLTDAGDVRNALSAAGYQVLYGEELTRADLLRTLADFQQKADGSEEAIFYFSGHAFQAGGLNYLAPLDIDLSGTSEVDHEAVKLDSVVAALSKSKGPRVIILDACRANPFSDPSAPGLVKPQNIGTNTLIGFSTAPGHLADDGTGNHSPYTRALLRVMRQPGIPAEDIFKQVRTIVETSTEGKQTPWEESSLVDQIYFSLPVFIRVQIANADDDAMFIINGEAGVTWGNDGSATKRIALHAGANPFSLRVYNQRSYTGGIQYLGGHLPEGWVYQISIKSDVDAPIATFSDSEDHPQDNGPRHGKWFTVVKGVLQLDEDSQKITLSDLDAHFWMR